MLRNRKGLRMDEESYRRLGNFLVASVPFTIAGIVLFYAAMLAHSLAVRRGRDILALVCAIVMLSIFGITFLQFLVSYVYWLHERRTRRATAAPRERQRPRRARRWLTGARGRRE